MVERLRDEVVRAGVDRLRLLGPLARRQHDHRQHGRVLARSELPADLEAVELRHHDVQQHEVRPRRPCDLESLPAIARRDDLVATRHQHRLEEPDVLGDVVGDEYAAAGSVIRALRAVRSDRRDEARNVHRLRDVAVEASGEKPLAVAFHRQRRQGDDGRWRPFARPHAGAAALRAPSMSGSWMSMRTRSGRFVAARSTACPAVVASIVS